MSMRRQKGGYRDDVFQWGWRFREGRESGHRSSGAGEAQEVSDKGDV